MSHLDKNDQDLIDAFIKAAKRLAPHQDDLHTIDPEAFCRGGLSLCDIEDYFHHRHGEFLAGAASIIGATIALGIELGEEA